MKKLWRIEVDVFVDRETEKKIRKILKPDLSVAGNPGKCIFCGEKTTWTIGKQYVCPRCTGKYGFVREDYLPGPCEVCNAQGEWVCGEKDEHSLCFRHRDDWFHWTRPPGLFPDRKKTSQEAWNKAWDDIWARFVKACQNLKVYS